ncbi:uncharacterized protein LOC100376556 [Saccoglossus kowalevskii]|uniref:Beta-lactamase-like protein 3-like n=1 Tax=Saccoglossus kowalevskii TaxID=10224 RepID=A0ABM0GJP5_SACKO|nr:PREDICTED: beta-lactamase-like protein 3-like [Saccoglossus kowalevskii]
MAIANIQRLIVVFLGASLATSLTPEQRIDLDNFINSTMTCKLVPGLTIALVQNGETVYARGYGVSNMETGDPVTADTLFDMASVTKSFTATLLAILLSDRADGVNFETPVRQYINDFIIHEEDDFRNSQTNLHDLLAHKEGKFDDILYLQLGGFDNVTRRNYVKHRQYLGERCPFRSEYVYQNAMYAVAGAIAEFIGEDSLENLLQTRVYDALGMTSSRIMHLHWDDDNFAESYIYMPEGYYHHVDKSTYWSNHVQLAAGGVLSSANDMAKYIKFLLNDGMDEKGNQLAHPLHFAETLKSQFAHASPSIQARPTYPVDQSTFTYALGWDNTVYRGYVRNEHAGAYPAFGSKLTIYKDVNIGIFTATNGPYGINDHDAMSRIQAYASDILLGEEPWLNTTTACTFPEPWEEKSIPAEQYNIWGGPSQANSVLALSDLQLNATRPLGDYEGIYNHKALGNTTIYMDESATLRYNYGTYGIGELKRTGDEFIFMATLEGTMSWALDYHLSGLCPVSFFSSDGINIDGFTFPYVQGVPTPMFKRVELDYDPTNEPPTPGRKTDPSKLGLHCNQIELMVVSLEIDYIFAQLISSPTKIHICFSSSIIESCLMCQIEQQMMALTFGALG